MEFRAKIFGHEEVIRSFSKLGSSVVGTAQQMKTAVLAGAMLLRNRAAELAPYLTGTLRRSIHVGGHGNLTPGFSPGQEYSDIGGEIISEDGVQMEVGTNLIYAGVQEFGATIHAKNKPYLVFKTKDGTWHSVKSVVVPPHPYLRPAFDQEKENVAREIDRVLDQLIRQAGF